MHSGGIISLIKSLPLIVDTFRKAMKDYSIKGESRTLRTDNDMSMKVVLLGSLAVIISIWLIPTIPVNLLGAVLIAIFGFFFATVSSRLVGLVGSSNNPVSGMAIATLLISTLALKSFRFSWTRRNVRFYSNRFYYMYNSCYSW